MRAPISGVRDGMVSSEGNGGVAQAGIRTPDGRIWFPSQGGVVVVDPRRADVPDRPIVATITPIGYPVGRAIELQPGHRLLRVRLGAVALGRARDVEFRYRVNDNQQWTDIGNRTELSFDQFSPGAWRLEVGARYAGGAWSGETARLAFRVAPRLTEHTSFWMAIVLLALLALLGLLWRERTHALQLERRVDERTTNLSQAMRTVAAQATEIKQTAARRHELFPAISHELRTPSWMSVHWPINCT